MAARTGRPTRIKMPHLVTKFYIENATKRRRKVALPPLHTKSVGAIPKSTRPARRMSPYTHPISFPTFTVSVKDDYDKIETEQITSHERPRPQNQLNPLASRHPGERSQCSPERISTTLRAGCYAQSKQTLSLKPRVISGDIQSRINFTFI